MATDQLGGSQIAHVDPEPVDTRSVCVVGLGYVGLPIAVAFDRAGHTVIGLDVDADKVDRLTDGEDPTGDVGAAAIADADVEFTTDETMIADAEFVIIAVPTPVDDLENPNLTFVESAGETIGRQLSEGSTVVLESTVYPGATEEILAPAIESTSGFTAGEEFTLGYSPERLNPGDDDHTLQDIVKIVSGQDDETLAELAELYESVVDAGVHRAPEITVAEAAKCIENIQRDLNIALMNELSITCNNLGLDTHAVLDAASTKWNFHDYRPGLVGGHCIPVDPFYIIYESERNGFSPKLIQQSREINDYMPKHVAEEVLKGLNECGNVLQESRVLVLGLAYKPNVGDVRTSVIGETITKLSTYGVDVVGYDPHADTETAAAEFDIEILDDLSFEEIDGVVLATSHDEFGDIEFLSVLDELAANPLLVDVPGFYTPETYAETPLTYRRI